MGRARFGELARLTSIEPATLSRFVSALHRDGLLRRRRSSADARAVTIALTEKGEVAFQATLPWALDVENTARPHDRREGRACGSKRC